MTASETVEILTNAMDNGTVDPDDELVFDVQGWGRDGSSDRRIIRTFRHDPKKDEILLNSLDEDLPELAFPVDMGGF